MKNTTMVPFIKWTGGKRKTIKYIEKSWPKNFNTYYEPFVGGGAVLLYFNPQKAVISDLNKELINLYRVISKQTSFKRLREYLLLMEYGHFITNSYDDKKKKIIKSSPFYKKIALIDRNSQSDNHLISLKTATKELRAARFIFLNKNSFNGLYRVNSLGYYNTPSKHKPTKTFNEKNIKKISSYLNSSVQIRQGHFSESLKDIKRGDFVYFDPPYDYKKDEKGFDAYQEGGFGISGQIELSILCKKLHEMGVKFMVSNHNTKLIQELYKGFKFKKFYVNRLIGGKGSSRKPAEEVLITNYD
ncbi:MAG: Dam family site-specific DNA-(adenine-N6)-methyltransferase [Mycoplasmatales bacterium]|nr:Dam family site-specific DNA-(adenine-N6)-methyltransferase [Mycoplasmatales bacterium]